jgi:hypothetical protein
MRALTNGGRPSISRLTARDVLATFLSTFLAVFLASWAAGCATASAPVAPTPPPAATAPRVEASSESPANKYRVELERASHLGRVLYLHDKVSSMATDAYLDHVAGGGVPVGGYLSLWDADAHGAPAMAFTVLFFTRDAASRATPSRGSPIASTCPSRPEPRPSSRT